MIQKPYFFTNKEWYKIIIVDGVPCVKLTDKAPKKVIESYKEYFKLKEEIHSVYER